MKRYTQLKNKLQVKFCKSVQGESLVPPYRQLRENTLVIYVCHHNGNKLHFKKMLLLDHFIKQKGNIFLEYGLAAVFSITFKYT